MPHVTLKIRHFEDMDITLWSVFFLVLVAMITAFHTGGKTRLLAGFKKAAGIFKTMWWRVLLGITLGGFLQVLIPQPVIAKWLGPASGMAGVLIGSFAGLFLTGGAFVTIPIIASIYAAGAGPGPIIALLTSGNLIRLHGLIVMHIPFFGARIAMVRYAVCLFMPPLVGIAGGAIYQFIVKA